MDSIVKLTMDLQLSQMKWPTIYVTKRTGQILVIISMSWILVVLSENIWICVAGLLGWMFSMSLLKEKPIIDGDGS